jgi:hypothetical protein
MDPLASSQSLDSNSIDILMDADFTFIAGYPTGSLPYEILFGELLNENKYNIIKCRELKYS